MKLRPTLLALAFLLLTTSLANASSEASVNAPVSPAEGGLALMAPVDEPSDSSDCATDELAFLNPAPGERAAGFCGTCSSPNCRGGSIGQRCGISGGRQYTCQYPFAESCTDGKPKCYCWTGPVP